METTRVQEHLLPVYDYVIVGAGTCGCILANRLSENRGVSVLILEAGKDDRENPDIAVPGKATGLTNSEYDWAFKSFPQKHAFKGLKDQRTPVTRGRGLGGSSSINFMLYMRGTPHDYDIWENMGCEGWSYRDVLPYFKKSECCLTAHLRENGYHGKDGPMMVSENSSTPLGDIFVEAGKELGYNETDCNSGDPIGFMLAQTNVGDGVRQSSAECYLRPASDRENLHIASHSHVTKIIVDRKVARGVEFVRNGVEQIVRARREVLLCAGSIGSPQILMLSGIGPREHLESFGIPILADLPVGDNLQDHTGCLGLEFEIDQPYSPRESEEEDACYCRERTGYLAFVLSDAVALVRTDIQDPGNPNPNILLFPSPVLLGSSKDGSLQTNFGISDEVWEVMFGGNIDKHGFFFNPTLTHPKSRGTIRLASRDPFAPPLIDPNTLSHPDDVTALVDGIKLAMKLTKTAPYKSVCTKFTSRVLPGYKGTPYTDAYWKEFVRTLTFNTYHPCGTCRMGRARDSTTVVDSRLRVKGIDRLRVIDASIMPEITCANLNATCVMIAEKAADIIKGHSSAARL